MRDDSGHTVQRAGAGRPTVSVGDSGTESGKGAEASGTESGKEKIFMSWKSEWYDLSGDLKVTVKAKDNNGKYSTFEFTCYASDELHSLERQEYLISAVRALGCLRGYYLMGIIDIKKIGWEQKPMNARKENEKIKKTMAWKTEWYDLIYLEEAARAMANLRDYYHAEIIDIKRYEEQKTRKKYVIEFTSKNDKKKYRRMLDTKEEAEFQKRACQNLCGGDCPFEMEILELDEEREEEKDENALRIFQPIRN